MSGMGDKMMDKAKQSVGKITDDKKMEVEGKAQEMKGKAKDTIDNIKDQASDKMAAHKQRG